MTGNVLPGSGTLRDTRPVRASKWRKRPVVIEALELTRENAGVVVQWVTAGGHVAVMRGGPKGGSRDASVIIRTLEGNHLADVGDWIVRGIAGEFYPVKPDIFAETYEQVTS